MIVSFFFFVAVELNLSRLPLLSARSTARLGASISGQKGTRRYHQQQLP